jgi:hypothetical protein
MMRPRPLGVSVLLVLATIAAGLVVRFGRLGLPLLVVKYGGSALWALMIYWIVSTVLRSWRLRGVGALAGAIATGVEFLKLYHSPGLDAFRLTLPGMLLLGRFFSVWDIVAYWVGIGVGVAVDGGIRRSWR